MSQLIDRHRRVIQQSFRTFVNIFPSHSTLSNGQFPREQATLSHHGGLHGKSVHVVDLIHHSVSSVLEIFKIVRMTRQLYRIVFKVVHIPSVYSEVESHKWEMRPPDDTLPRLWGVEGEVEWEGSPII